MSKCGLALGDRLSRGGWGVDGRGDRPFLARVLQCVYSLSWSAIGGIKNHANCLIWGDKAKRT